MVSYCLGCELTGEEGKTFLCFSVRADRAFYPECQLSLLLEGEVKKPSQLVAENCIAPELEVWDIEGAGGRFNCGKNQFGGGAGVGWGCSSFVLCLGNCAKVLGPLEQG